MYIYNEEIKLGNFKVDGYVINIMSMGDTIGKEI